MVDSGIGIDYLKKGIGIDKFRIGIKVSYKNNYLSFNFLIQTLLPWQSYLEYKLLRVPTHGKKESVKRNWNWQDGIHPMSVIFPIWIVDLFRINLKISTQEKGC